jgi:hypothetical protein
MENLHHVFFRRRDYNTRAERKLRNNRTFIIPMEVGIHSDLHAHIPYVPKPNHNLIYGILDNLDNHLHRGPLDGVLYTVEYLEGVETKQAERLAMNLTRQLGFVVLGVSDEWKELQI